MARGLPVEKLDFCAKVGNLIDSLVFSLNIFYTKLEYKINGDFLRKRLKIILMKES